MNNQVRSVLERPFPKEHLRTRVAAFGRELTYVETHHYVRRLNEAFGGDWGFEVLEHRVLEAEVVVLGRLTGAGIAKTAFGGSAITRSRDTGVALSLADDLKAAASDSLKKCSSLLGLGLHLYGDTTPEAEEKPRENPAREDWRPHRLTERQRSAVVAIATRKGLGEDALQSRIVEMFGAPLNDLTRRQASELITRLNSNGNGGNSSAAQGGAA